MEKIINVRLDNDYLKKINLIKDFISKICLMDEKNITTSFLIKYCLNSTYHDIQKEINKHYDYYKEKGL